MNAPPWTARFERASELLAGVRDVVVERPFAATPPSWCEARGWTAYLDAFSDEEVDVAERGGLASYVVGDREAPPDLVDLAAAVREVCALEMLRSDGSDATASVHVPERKRAQIAAFAAAVRALPVRPERIVDVGSGHGHLTRHLAQSLGVVAEGFEVNDALVARAASLARGTGACFRRVDVRREAIELRRDDLVVGLHCCGDLGDLAVTAARSAQTSIALMGCCPQKRDGERLPLAASSDGLTLPHAALGLANRHEGDDGIEDDLATRIRSRVNRLALLTLLTEAGLALAPGEEMRGVNRRYATKDFGSLVAKAFEVRGLPSPSQPAIDRAEREAWTRYASIRRWSLARDMFARLVEVWIALDRAAYLESGGYACTVSIAFDAGLSPRNLIVTGRS